MRSHALLVSLALVALACGSADERARAERLGTAVQADTVTVCPSGATVEGIDVSHWNDTIDWQAVQASGVAFAFVKATENTSYVDPTLDDNWSGIQQYGLVGGAYHFFHADTDAIAQANHFLSTIQGLSGDVLPVLDLETDNGESEATIASRAAQWLDYVAMKTGKTPIVYTSPGFLSDFSDLSAYTLWIANWGVNCPKVPDAWPSWAFWQYSDSGNVPGISPGVDVNRFNGSLADLKAFVGASSSSSSSSSGSSSSSSGAGGAAGGGAPDAGGADGTGGTHAMPPASSGGASDGASSGAGAANGVVEGEGDADGGCAVAADVGGDRPWVVWAVALALVLRRPRRVR